MSNSNAGIVATYTDRYGDIRKIHGTRNGLKRKREFLTPTLLLNQAVAGLIGARIKAERQHQGLTLEQLAIKAGLVSVAPKSRMWEIENAIRKEGIRHGTIYALAIALGVEATQFLPSIAEVSWLVSVEHVPTTKLTVLVKSEEATP